MPPRDTPTALELRVGFDVGLYSRDDVASWVDDSILAADQPCDALLELATLCHRSDTEVAGLLDELSEPLRSEERFLLYVKAIGALYEKGSLDLGGALHALRQQLMFETPSEYELDGLHDAYALAVQGTYGTLAEVEQAFRRFLKETV